MATTAFVRRTQPEVWRVCARLGDRADADDLTQEVYLRALPALAAFRGESSARTWLLQIARYVCADHVRGRTRRRSLLDRLVQREATAGGVTRRERTGELDLDDLIGRLDPDRREAFVLTQVAGLSYAEAAMVCEVPIGTIRSRVARRPRRPARRPRRRAGQPTQARRRVEQRVVDVAVAADAAAALDPLAAGQVGEPAPGLGEDHRHRADVVGLHDRVDHRRRPAGGDQRVAVAVAPGAQHGAGRVEAVDRARPASG